MRSRLHSGLGVGSYVALSVCARAPTLGFGGRVADVRVTAESDGDEASLDSGFREVPLVHCGSEQEARGSW